MVNDELIRLLKINSERIGLDAGFYDEMLSSNDWTFVLKLSALFEAVLVEGAVNKLKNKNIKEVLSHLELSNRKCGKVAVAKCLDLISDEDAKFIDKIAEIRNQLAHRIDQRQFTIRIYINDQCIDNPNKLKSLSKTLSNRLKDQIILSDGKSMNRAEAILVEPKEMILSNAMDIMANIAYLNENS